VIASTLTVITEDCEPLFRISGEDIATPCSVSVYASEVTAAPACEAASRKPAAGNKAHPRTQWSSMDERWGELVRLV
jgi:hypothetical protein